MKRLMINMDNYFIDTYFMVLDNYFKSNEEGVVRVNTWDEILELLDY